MSKLVVNGMEEDKINKLYSEMLKPQCRLSYKKIEKIRQTAKNSIEEKILLLKARCDIVEYHLKHGFNCKAVCRMTNEEGKK